MQWPRVSREVAVAIVKELVRKTLLWVLPPGVGVIGWLQEVPWFYVIVGVIISGAGMMTWLVQFDEWRARNRVEHKLIFQRGKIHLTQVDNRLAAIRFGFDVANTAVFPIRFRVEDLKTRLVTGNNNQLFPPSREYSNRFVTIPPTSTGFFFDHDIGLPPGSNGPATAYLKCKLSYGRVGRLDHALDMNKNTAINVVGPTISGGQHWYDL